MATGDMKNNVMKLLREVRRMKIQVEPDIQGLSVGSPSSFLSLLHAAMMHYSLPLANWFTHHGYDLYGRSDLRFLQELYRVLRDVFCYRPKLMKEQFLSMGFAERKVLMTRDVLLFCQAKNAELTAHTTSVSLTRKRRALGPSSNHGNISTATKGPTDVLTIQERPGIGSAWSESTKNIKIDEPCSSPPIPTPSTKLLQNVSVANELDVTIPSTPPPLRSPSPPVLSPSSSLQSSSPTLAQQSSPAPQFISPETLDITARVVRHQSPSSDQQPSLPLTSEVTENREEGGSSPPRTEGWGSLPKQEGTTGSEDDGHQDQESSPAIGVDGNRLEQLTKMVEKLSAKFVLLETQIKLSHSQTEASSLEQGHISGSAGRGEEDLKQPLREITSENQPQTIPVKWAEASGHSPVLSPDPLDHRSTGYTHSQHTSRSVHIATPSTPEETKRLVESLRARARSTKEFLQFANSRLVDSS